MIECLKKLGINEFKNAKYSFTLKKIDILGDEKPLDTKVIIDTWEVKGGFQYINIIVVVDSETSTTISLSFKDKALFDITKIANYIGESIMYKLELSVMNGYEEEYYFTSNYNSSLEVFKHIISKFGKLEIEKIEPIDDIRITNIPFISFNKLKDNILETVKDLKDEEEVKEAAEIFMTHNGEEYRALLYSDSKLIFLEEDDRQIVELIEDLMFEFYSEDEVLLEE